AELRPAAGPPPRRRHRFGYGLRTHLCPLPWRPALLGQRLLWTTRRRGLRESPLRIGEEGALRRAGGRGGRRTHLRAHGGRRGLVLGQEPATADRRHLHQHLRRAPPCPG